MLESKQNRIADSEVEDLRWRDLYRVGAIASIIVVILVILAIVAFLIWPFTPGEASTMDIFTLLQNDRLGGLVSLDLLLPLIELVLILPLLALYIALKRVNESYALIALVLGLIAVILFIVARPLVELVYLSEQYAVAKTEAARNQYLAAGKAQLALFNGTAWMVATVFIGTSGLISSLLMLRSRIFSKTTAYVGIIATVPSFGFFIPVIGPLLLFVATFGGVIWYVLIAQTFIRLGWGHSNASQGIG